MSKQRLTALQQDEYEERAAILEFDAGMSRDEAERKAHEWLIDRSSRKQKTLFAETAGRHTATR